MPLIMQEAQASGVPTLVADVGGMTECVTDEVNGFTFRMGDVADLQRKMQMIIDQPVILNGIKENIRNPQPGEYRVTSLAEEAKLYLEQYERIVRKSP
jgi:glycosyltransferase involved in cell wall biosynthesis